MPELPEVETIRLGLQKYLVGKRIERVEIRLPKLFEGDPRKITGANIASVRRFGKALVIDLDPSTSSGQAFSLAVHVKMTGQLVYVGKDRPKESRISSKVGTVPNAFTHVIFHLSENAKLFYNDIRQFGWLKVLPTSEVEQMKFISELGPEPFKDLTPEKFKEILRDKPTAIKVLLMDQKILAGVGNIYANDALYLSKINPKRGAKHITEEEAESLYEAIHTVLKKGLELGGSSEHTYVTALGEEGAYQKHFLVYGKAGKACTKCGSRIIRTTLGGRGTFFCEVCQV